MPTTGADVTDTDLAAVVASARALAAGGGTIAPEDVLAVTFFESAGFHPAAKNAAACVGLNQFCGATFTGAVPDLSADDYAALSAADQLTRYIVPWWLAAKGGRRLDAAADLHWLNFKPAEYKPGSPDDAVVTSDPIDLKDNPALVHGGKAFITKGDLTTSLDKAKSQPRYRILSDRLAAIAGTGPIPSPPPAPPAVAASSSGFPVVLGLAAAAAAALFFTKGG